MWYASSALSTLWGIKDLKSSTVMDSGRFSKRYFRYQYGSRPFALAVSVRV
jgi:hypothetical protein